MKNRNENFVFKIAVVLWALLLVFIFYTSLKFESENLDTESAQNVTSKFDLLSKKIEMENLKPIVISIPESNETECFYYLSDYERWLVESIVAGESGIEPYEGKVAVANCILNACLLENKRPEEIQKIYGYFGWKPIEEFESGCLQAYGNKNLSDEVRQAVSQVFDDGEILDNEILWFYAPKYSNGTFHQTQKFIFEIGGHKFYSPWN